MGNEDKTKEQLTTELHELRQRLAKSEKEKEELKRSQATTESKARPQIKVDNILLPEAPLETMELSDIIDTQEIQFLMDDFYHLTNIGVAILDIHGKILVATGWQDVCTKFHRIHPETSKNCLQSDIELSGRAEPGTFRLYQCQNNMWDMSTPITVGGKRVGNLYLGQFFFSDESLDMDLFRSQARRYGFDENEYLGAVQRVPRWNRDTVNRAMSFYTKFAHLISKLSYGNVKLAQTLTEKDQFLESLRKSEEQFMAMFETASIGMAQADPQTGRWLRVNWKMCDITGYSPTEMLAMRVPEITHPEDRERDWAAFQNVVSGKSKSYRLEKRYIRKDDKIIWVNVNMTVIRDPSGQPTRTMATIEDITDRKRAEQALRESEDRFRKIYEHMAVGVARVSMDFRIEATNKAYCSMLGYQEEELIGKHLKDITHPEVLEENLLKQSKLAKGEIDHFRMEKRFIHKKGRIIHGILDANLVRDAQNKPLYFLGSVLDITDRKLAEEALRVSHERFLAVLDSIDATIYVADMETHEILFMNKNMIESFGMDMTGAICWDAFRKESGPCGHCTNDQLIDKKGKPTGVCVWQGKNPITKKWYINYDRAIQWTDGRLVRLQIATDITELKRMEEELRQAQKMEAIGILAGGIAHEFNNILGIILGYAELAKDDIPEWNPARFNLDEIKASSLRAKDVVRQLLTFSRKTEETRQPINLSLVIKEAINFLRSSIPTNIEFRQNIAEGCHTIIADSTQIHQVMLNLSTNAAHVMEEAGGILGFSLQNVTLKDTSHGFDPKLQPGEYVMLQVTDTGCGIQPEILDRIFDPYFTTKEVGKGSGMGLAVVHGIVEAHGGTIRVESRLGIGTTFRILFPAVKDEVTSAVETDEELPTGTERILFIDDEPAIAKLGQLILEKLGYQVQAETSAEKALEIFAANPERFDLIVTDTTMPGMTGDQLIKKVLQIRPEMKTILCTGYSHRVDEERARTIGANAYVMKPLDKRKLAKTVRKVLDGTA